MNGGRRGHRRGRERPESHPDASTGLAARKFRARPWHGTEFGSNAARRRPKPRRANALTSPRPGTTGKSRFPTKPDTPRSSEPILIPKLRIQFADFPYLHYSIDQRLFTLDTCCGYGYELMRVRRHLPRIFKVPPATRGCRENCGTLRQSQNPFSLREDSRASAAYAEKTTLPRAPVGVS